MATIIALGFLSLLIIIIAIIIIKLEQGDEK